MRGGTGRRASPGRSTKLQPLGKATPTMMPMTISAANGRFAPRASAPPLRPPVAPAPAPAPAPASAAAPAATTGAGSGVRKAEAKKGETPDPTHKLQALIAAERKSALKIKAAPVDSSSEDDY